MEGVVIDRHKRHQTVKVRLWTGEEVWVHEHFIDGQVPVRVGDILAHIDIKFEPVIVRARKKPVST